MVARHISSFNALMHLSVHWKGWSFFRRVVSGLAIVANPEMKAHWYPSTPRVLCTSLTDLSIVGQFFSPSTFDGSGWTVSPSSRISRYSTCHFSNLHFSGFRKNDSSFNTWRTAFTTLQWYSTSSFVAMSTSSIYTWTSSPYCALMGLRSLFITL